MCCSVFYFAKIHVLTKIAVSFIFRTVRLCSSNDLSPLLPQGFRSLVVWLISVANKSDISKSIYISDKPVTRLVYSYGLFKTFLNSFLAQNTATLAMSRMEKTPSQKFIYQHRALLQKSCSHSLYTPSFLFYSLSSLLYSDINCHFWDGESFERIRPEWLETPLLPLLGVNTTHQL